MATPLPLSKTRRAGRELTSCSEHTLGSASQSILDSERSDMETADSHSVSRAWLLNLSMY